MLSPVKHHNQALILDKVGIDIVHGCQLQCVGCPNAVLRPKIKKMSADDFLKIINNIDVDHVNILRLFNFGEPLLNEGLPEILENLKKRTWTCSNIELSTNGQYHDFPTLERAIKSRVLNTLNVSCDGDGTPDDYERLRPPSRWPKFIEFLKKAKEFRDAHDPNLTLMTRTICTDPVAQQRWLSLLVPLGFKVEFRDWLYLPQSAENLTGKPISVPEGVCSFMRPGNRLYIDYDGTVVPCCAHPKAAELGNILEQKFTDIFLGNKRTEVVKFMHFERKKMPHCNACPY